MVEIAQCPECEQDFVLFEEVWSGQYVRCNHCGVDLEIVDADTMEMDWAYRSIFDWDGWQELNAFLDAGWKRSRRRRDEGQQDNRDDWEDERWH